MFKPITDEQWAVLEPLFIKPPKRGRGKPHACWRTVLNSILFVLLTGTKWSLLPQTPEFASKSATHRWYLIWDKNGFLKQVLDTMDGHANIANALRFPPKRNRRPKNSANETQNSEEMAYA